MGKQFQYIGKSLRNVDAEGKITGATRFLTDIYLDGMIWAYPVFAAVPFGGLKAVDLSRAQAAEGFIDVILACHIPGENQVGVIIEDQPLLADKVVRFVGDVIGVVVAETAEAAARIAALVDVEYEEYKPYFSIGDSKSAAAGFIHDTNVACTHRILKGDCEDGFRCSDLIVEADLRTSYQEHFYLEPQGCIAIPEEDGRMTILGSLQCPYYVQKAVSRALGTPLEAVRVIQAPTGGAFGGKEDVPSEMCARAALAAGIVKRPVKMVYRRVDDTQLTSKRHPFRMHYKVGVTGEGKILAADVTLESNAGAYATLSPVVSYRSTMQSLGPYVVPNVWVQSTAYYTNMPPAGAFRGFGSPQAAFGHERMMDIIADKLGMDPVDLRLKNVIQKGEATITGQKLSASVGAKETILKARVASGWEQGRKQESPPGRYLTGMGVATCIYGNCLGAAGWHMDGAGVKVQVRRDGSIGVAFGLTEMGQGAMTVVAQMAAEALGVNPRRIVVSPTDTRDVPDSGPSVASRNVIMSGNAIRDAAARLLPVMVSAAAELLNCDETHVEIRADTATDTRSGNTLGFSELADYLFASNRQTEVSGWWHVPDLQYDPEVGLGEAYFTYSYATHVARVRVDTLTGLVQVDKVWAVHDVGTVINPAGLEGQVEGGVAQGTGWALTEHFQTDQGIVTTRNFSTYLLPTALDVPEVETVIVEDPEPLGPWGAKGVGEPAIIPTAAAIANAVSHALGVPVNEIPITPENVLRLLQAGGKVRQ